MNCTSLLPSSNLGGTMSNRAKVLAANIVGILVLMLGMFGIDVPPEQQTQIVAGLGAIGCVINSVLASWRDSRGHA